MCSQTHAEQPLPRGRSNSGWGTAAGAAQRRPPPDRGSPHGRAEEAAAAVPQRADSTASRWLASAPTATATAGRRDPCPPPPTSHCRVRPAAARSGPEDRSVPQERRSPPPSVPLRHRGDSGRAAQPLPPPGAHRTPGGCPLRPTTPELQGLGLPRGRCAAASSPRRALAAERGIALTLRAAASPAQRPSLPAPPPAKRNGREGGRARRRGVLGGAARAAAACARARWRREGRDEAATEADAQGGGAGLGAVPATGERAGRQLE